MQPHPEGGFFTRTYHSSGLIPQAALPAEFTGERYFSTAIVFLLKENDFSALHASSKMRFGIFIWAEHYGW
jgi:predicted cupin superfamily sugar epimerase